MADPEGKSQSGDGPEPTEPDRAPRQTPWGEKQTEYELTPGFTMVHTASHGGIWLTEQQRQMVPDHLNQHSVGGEGIWWEEDSAWSLPVLHFLSRKEKLQANEDFVLESAGETAREWYPDAYRQIHRENAAHKLAAEFKNKLINSPAKEIDRSR